MKLSSILIVILAATLYIIMSLVFCLKRAKAQLNLLKQKSKIQLTKCQKCIEGNIEFTKQLYDIFILWKSSPPMLAGKLENFLLSASGYQEIIKKTSIDAADICTNGLISHFSSNFPELSQKDLEFCSLICLGYPSHTMQTFYELGNSTSYYNRRKRLRTKLHLTTNENLETVIREKTKMLSHREH